MKMNMTSSTIMASQNSKMGGSQQKFNASKSSKLNAQPVKPPQEQEDDNK